MIFGSAEILICLVPVFIAMATLGVTLFINDRKKGK